ncbi:NlpC/P60 family protein [Kineosporia sp. NBRC 101731]|uniref:C40 family peptidase n=1 Tax=Kineosporia sp. NBRC 101731 TaxID=3032199 RepID=UPI0024A246C7|nr:NlpC/P60 family protein [Kineosporia sp. NBRC 101731]GLY33936.1 hypothetical protein Kisp02_73010 [Kineosporia sp. NBRC 101731]
MSASVADSRPGPAAHRRRPAAGSPHVDAQVTYGTPFSNSQLQPGDLVFFYSPIGHVGIYLGDNTMVHTPATGSSVNVSTLWQAPSAAVRLS